MAIGEFGGAPASAGPAFSNGLYWMYEASHAALLPARAFADMTKLYFKNPLNPLAHTTYGKSLAAAAELFERSTRRYAKPAWGIDSVQLSSDLSASAVGDVTYSLGLGIENGARGACSTIE